MARRASQRAQQSEGSSFSVRSSITPLLAKSGFRVCRQFAVNTMYGVLAACSVMMVAKVARWNTDPGANYVLVRDSSKGELDNVKYIREEELPKRT